MRIIAGTARGRPLAAPRGRDTRPTLDRVRESLFNILRNRLADARVLDLFAGSGALGLEALSRGAAFAAFVDQAPAAQAAIVRNVQTLGFEDVARLYRCDWRAALPRLRREPEPFDLIFLDPPYCFSEAEALLAALREGPWLREDGLVVYEHDKALPPAFVTWRVADARTYGDTQLTLLEKPQPPEGAESPFEG